MISCGMDGLLHIIYDNTMTSGHFICVHMYMKSPRDNMLALYMRDVVTMLAEAKPRRKSNNMGGSIMPMDMPDHNT